MKPCPGTQTVPLAVLCSSWLRPLEQALRCQGGCPGAIGVTEQAGAAASSESCRSHMGRGSSSSSARVLLSHALLSPGTGVRDFSFAHVLIPGPPPALLQQQPAAGGTPAWSLTAGERCREPWHAGDGRVSAGSWAGMVAKVLMSLERDSGYEVCLGQKVLGSIFWCYPTTLGNAASM